MTRKHIQLFVSLSLCLILAACGTYYTKHAKFHQLFVNEQVLEADQLLEKDKRAARGKTRLLHYLNRGITHHLMQQYEASNQFFEQAYRIYQDFVAHPADSVLSFLVNPTVTDYRGEEHEILLIHYYKALNYLQLGDLSAALVECRRLNIQLNQLSDKYTSANTYRRDAFIHVLMGLIYQANYEYNDAFIAYRNAVEIYQEDYQRLFGLEVPTQLKKDLIYAAYKTGFYDQVDYYKHKFGLTYDPSQEPEGGDVICLWNSGLGPIKHEWHINFVLVKGAGGVVNFVNEDLGLVFPFPLGDDSREANQSLSDLHLLRVAFPKYIERPLLYNKAAIQVQGNTYVLEQAEDINAISFQVLHERMIWEFSKSLLRVALKKIAEYQLRKQNEMLGTILGVVNFATEKADTRNWQTIPHSIYYTRMRMPEGRHQFSFQAKSSNTPYLQQSHTFTLHIHHNQTVFYPIHTLDYLAKS
ncbi:MAG: COG3014 family protein [Candidatus Amoebophilus sp.]